MVGAGWAPALRAPLKNGSRGGDGIICTLKPFSFLSACVFLSPSWAKVFFVSLRINAAHHDRVMTLKPCLCTLQSSSDSPLIFPPAVHIRTGTIYPHLINETRAQGESLVAKGTCEKVVEFGLEIGSPNLEPLLVYATVKRPLNNQGISIFTSEKDIFEDKRETRTGFPLWG